MPPAWRVWLLTAALGAAALALWFGVVRQMPGAVFPAAVSPWLLLAAFAVAEITVVHVYFGREGQALSLTEIPLIVGLFAGQPATVLAVRLVAAAAVRLVRGGQPPMKLAFNIAWIAVETQTALIV